MDYNLTVNSFIAYMRLDSGWPDSSRLFSPGHPRSIIQTLGSSTAVSGIAAFYEFRFHAGRHWKCLHLYEYIPPLPGSNRQVYRTESYYV